jgi:hypothetical protein
VTHPLDIIIIRTCQKKKRRENRKTGCMAGKKVKAKKGKNSKKFPPWLK